MVRSRIIAIAAVVTFAAASCGSVSGPRTGPTVADAAELTVHDSCGTNFTVRDEAGTTRLTIVTGLDSAKAVEPGTFELRRDGSGGGFLELGSDLEVWPCHDIGSDFDGEEVREAWAVIGGSIELLDPIVPDESGGGGSSAVRAVVDRVEVQTGEGDVIVLEGIELLNPRWGFYGG